MTEQRGGHRFLRLAFTAVLLLAGLPIEVRGTQTSVLPIQLIVFRGLEDRQIDMVRREIDAIWAAQDVTIEWSADATAPCVRVVVDRSASPLPAAGRDEHWALAATRVIEGRITPPIYVSVDAAERVVRAASPTYSPSALARILVPRVVGRAIAHELAHVLLNTRAHTSRGLLRARFTPDDLVSPLRDTYNLDPGQIAVARQHQALHALP